MAVRQGTCEDPPTTRGRRRWPRRLGVAAGLLGLAVAVAVTIAVQRVPGDDLDVIEPGSLRIADGVGASTAAGDVRVSVEDDLVEIHHLDTLVWRSQPDTAFIGAATGDVHTQEHRGYFWLDVDHDDRWSDQELDAITADERTVTLRGTLTGASNDLAWSATVEPRRGGVTLDVRVDGADAVALWSGRDDGAAVHGFGEQFTDFDLDDRLLPVVVREQGVGRGEQPLTFLADVTNHGAGGTDAMTYAAWSSWVSADLRGVRLDPALPQSHAVAVGDTRDDGRIGLQVWAPRVRAELSGAETPRELVVKQHAPSPATPAMPEWTGAGAVVGLQGGTDEVRKQVRQLRDAGAEISGVWLQDWTGQRTTSFGERLWWTWQLDEQRYPGWQALSAELRDAGIEVTTYVNPFLVDATAKADPTIDNLWQEAVDDGHLVTNTDGDPYPLDQGGFDAYLVDLTDPEARDWYSGIIADEVLVDGVSGFMADFGEGLPLDAVLADGDAAVEHNRWPLLWARTVRDACTKADLPDCVTWFRSGSVGMGEVIPMAWNGDQLVSFSDDDGLGSVLRGAFSAGVSGWPLTHSDVGGYTSIDAVVKDYVRTPELLARWAELEAFGTMLRTHEGNRPDANTQVSDTQQTREQFARMTRVFAALAPYRSTVVDEARRLGLPALRHAWLVAPDSAAAEQDTAFFLGDDVFVAPVLQEGADAVDVTLPPGRWTHLFTGAEHGGDDTINIDAPIGTPAAFVRADSEWADRLLSAVSAAISADD